MPPLLLQPLVENAVKHGVEPSARGGKLRVQTELRGSRVVVRITNTLPTEKPGAAGSPSQGHGIALANVRARLALLHDMQCDFSAGVQEGLYQVRITLPAPRATTASTTATTPSRLPGTAAPPAPRRRAAARPAP